MNLEQLRSYKPQILKLSEENGVSNIRVFGSVARGEADETSDVDLLVTFAPNAGWNYFGFGPELEELLGCKVDVVSDRAINKHIREYILNDVIPL